MGMLQRKVVLVGVLFFCVLNGPLASFAQVTLQTGSAVFSLPIFNWQDDKSRLTSGIALNYSSGNGLKVDDIASNEGTGWSLTAGGVISRIQVDVPDDQPAYIGANPNNNDQDLTKYPAGYLYDTVPITRGCPEWLAKYPTYGSKNELYSQHNIVAGDRELDRFVFQFNGKSGEFVIDTAGGWHGVTLGDSKMQISLQLDPTMALNQGIRTTITSFTITDEDGLIYIFKYHGLTKLMTNRASSGDGTKTANAPKLSNGGVYCQSVFDEGANNIPWINANIAYPFIISNWYLSEVDDPFTGRKISYYYKPPVTLNTSAGTDISYNAGVGSDSYVMISYKKSIATVMDIDSIVYPDGHLVNFNYAATPRSDYPGEYALSNITVRYRDDGNLRYLSQYQLNTTYFIQNRYGTPSNSVEQGLARLCLRSIKKIGVDLKDDSPPYQFDYYLGSGGDSYVPPPFYYCKDIWGYYNGNNSVAYSTSLPVTAQAINPYHLSFDMLRGLCFRNQTVGGVYLNPKTGYAQNGLLKEIIYPTGGSLTYTYAQDTGAFILTPATIRAMGGVHVSQTSSSDGGYSNGCGTPIVTNYNYVVSGAGSASSLWGVEAPNDSLTSNNFWQEEKKTIHFSWSNPLGTCLWHYVYPGIMQEYEAVNLDAFERIMNALSPVLGVLGAISTISDVIALWGPGGSIVAVILDVITAVLSYAFSCPYQSKTSANTVYYNYDLNSAAPLPAQFKQVEITESSGGIGKTVEKFTQGDINDPGGPDYSLWFPGPNNAFSMKQRFAPWAYGLPKLISVYDSSGDLIKQTQNIYDTTNAQWSLTDPATCCATNYWNIPSFKCTVTYNRSLRSDVWASQAQYDAPAQWATASTGDMIVDQYYMYTGHTNVSTTYERTYRTTDPTQYVQTETDYSYNNGATCIADNYCQPVVRNFAVKLITTKQSNGDIDYKNIYYTTDYNTGTLATLVQKNIFSLPVATMSSVQKADGTFHYLSEKVTEFAQVANGDIKPSRTLEQRFASPATTLVQYSGPTTTSYANYKIPEVFTYDANSNLAGMQDEGNRNMTNIYNYNDKYIVASVINANALVDKPAYTSFENADLSRSGWTLAGTESRTAQAQTGDSSLTLQASGVNSLTAGSLNTATAYILSFWATNGNVVVTGGATLTKSAPTYNGFTYYEYSIAAGTSSVVVKGGASAVNIDELRLYPAGARMRTNTYDAMIGKTSDCDENNRITYYTYDQLGRLQFVQDETHNVLKMYEYNNVSQSKQIGCPTTYSNPAISELVVRNNCAVGYQGDTAAYTIPAAQFNSTISQWDADIQAEIYLLTNAQNYANTNAGCAQVFWNQVQYLTDTTGSCGGDSVGGLVTYTVPANTYSSIISLLDANNQALADIAANAQMYANLPANKVCSVTDSADWEWNPGNTYDPEGPTYCTVVGGTPHQIVGYTDVNPNSPTYNQIKWGDIGASSACPAGSYTTSVVATNGSTEAVTLVYQNLFSGVNYTFTAAAGASNVTEGTIPNGPYTVTMTPTTYSSSYPLVYTMNPGSTQTYYAEVAFGNVMMSGSTCTVNISPENITVNVSNEYSTPLDIEFLNTVTGVPYYVIVPGIRITTPGTISTTVPQGTYNIIFTDGGTESLTWWVYSSFKTGVTPITFTNVVMTTTCQISIDTPPQ
jgi:Family of unknown function (DUF5977)